ncbi:MAG: response regulator transcription factor [Firmicutes bacterium]|nr:response regulator transcription factor [Bacillota bacterium]
MSLRSIFVVDDEANIRSLISQYLRQEGFSVETFESVEEMAERLNSGFPDMFILDIMLPGKDGLDFCQDLRRRSGVPVIFISARGEEMDRVLGLELGGDDYLSKPFSPRELVARVRSVFRRGSGPQQSGDVLEAGNLKVFPADHRVLIDGQTVMLTPKEYELLLMMVQHPHRTFNRQELLDRVWGYDYVGDFRAVDELVKRLRKKLREKGAVKNIGTVWGYGYRLEE